MIWNCKLGRATFVFSFISPSSFVPQLVAQFSFHHLLLFSVSFLFQQLYRIQILPFHIHIIDWTIGYSGLYHIPDIPGYRVGIKTVERDKFPIIFKDNSYPQIICIKSTKYNNLIFVCGLATSNVLNNYQDDDLILDPNLRARGTKTGFYGFEQLVPIKSLNDLSTYKK